MESFRFKDKIADKEYNLPKVIKTVEGEDLDLQAFLGHVISWGRKRLNRSLTERKAEHTIRPDLDVK